MNYEKAIEAYNQIDDEIAKLEEQLKKAKAPLLNKKYKIVSLVSRALVEEGIKNAQTPYGTAYFSTHHNCSVKNQESFFQYVQQEDRFDLMEKRASKKAVKEYVEDMGEPPPGVEFGAVQVLVIRRGDKQPPV